MIKKLKWKKVRIIMAEDEYNGKLIVKEYDSTTPLGFSFGLLGFDDGTWHWYFLDDSGNIETNRVVSGDTKTKEEAIQKCQDFFEYLIKRVINV